ncbi:MAG: hypothetical protein H7Z76_13405 [Methylotenera sp.]|nr:hypothetical protein [Flavobacterium sp.]
MDKIIKTALAILFFLCLLPMPYGFYQLVRFAAMVGFVILAYHAHEEQQDRASIIYVVLALLFQPLFKIPLGRSLWNVVDVIVGIGLLMSIWMKIIKRKS